MKANAVLPCDRRNLLDWLDRSRLIVGMHNADQNRACIDRAPDRIWIDLPRAIDLYVADFGAEPFEKCEGLKDCGMFRHLRDDVVAFLTKGEIAANEGAVVGFTSSAREYNLLRHASQQRGDLTSGTVESRLGGARRPVVAGWVSEGFLQQRQHGGDHPRIDGRAGVVVEVDRRHLCNDLTGPPPSVCHRNSSRHRPHAWRR